MFSTSMGRSSILVSTMVGTKALSNLWTSLTFLRNTVPDNGMSLYPSNGDFQEVE